MLALLRAAGYEFREGRAPEAPELAEGAVQQRIVAVRRDIALDADSLKAGASR